LADLVFNDTILDAVDDLYGPDLLCWSSTLFAKEANTASFDSWHQDSTYWGLSRPDVVTAWCALTPSNRTNGALEVVSGTHLLDQLPHHDRFSGPNTSGQRRIGFAMRYIPTSVAQLVGDRDSAMTALHERVTDATAQRLYRGTGVTSFTRDG
jgi:hypothetical protein